jgi:hypothetical protein
MVVTIKMASVIAQPSTKVEPKMDMEIIDHVAPAPYYNWVFVF